MSQSQYQAVLRARHNPSIELPHISFVLMQIYITMHFLSLLSRLRVYHFLVNNLALYTAWLGDRISSRYSG